MKKKLMKVIYKLFALLTGLILVSPSISQTLTHNQTGNQGGYYYSFWNDNTSGTASITLGGGGQYSTQWTNIGNFTAGKGWKVGRSDRIIRFSGLFDGGTNGYLAVYGWTKDSLVEYYIVENYGEWVPPGGTPIDSFTSDGGTYKVYKTRRIQRPSIVGTATFSQYWSIRTTKRSSGTITFANHVAAWKKNKMILGSIWDYQIMESEGYKSSGSSDIVVDEEKR